MHSERTLGGRVEGVAVPLNQASGGTAAQTGERSRQDLPPTVPSTVLAVSWLPGTH